MKCTGDTRNKLTGIYRNCNQLRSLISELLDFRKQEQGHTHIHARHADMSALLRNTATLYTEYTLGKDITLQIEVPDQMLMWFDPKQMQKVVSNLVSNAIKHQVHRNAANPARCLRTRRDYRRADAHRQHQATDTCHR